MNLLKELVEKIDAVVLSDGEAVASLEVRPDEVAVGVLPELLRKHYVVYTDAQKNLDVLAEQDPSLAGVKAMGRAQRARFERAKNY